MYVFALALAITLVLNSYWNPVYYYTLEMMPKGITHWIGLPTNGMTKDWILNDNTDWTPWIGDLCSSMWNSLEDWIQSSDSSVASDPPPTPPESAMATTPDLLEDGMHSHDHSGARTSSTSHRILTNDLTPISSCNTDYDYFSFLPLLLTFLSSLLLSVFLFRTIFRNYRKRSDHIKELLKEMECLRKRNYLLVSENVHKTGMLNLNREQVIELSMKNQELHKTCKKQEMILKDLESGSIQVKKDLSLKTEECNHFSTKASVLLVENENLRECLNASVTENEMLCTNIKDLETQLYDAVKESQRLRDEHEARDQYFGGLIRDLKAAYENDVSELRDQVKMNMNELMQVNCLFVEMQQREMMRKLSLSSSPPPPPGFEDHAEEKNLCSKVLHPADQETHDDLVDPAVVKLSNDLVGSYSDDPRPMIQSHSTRHYEVVVFGHSYVRDLATLDRTQLDIEGNVFHLSYITVPGGTFSTFINNRRYLEQLKAKSPDFVIVVLGGNDLKYDVDLSENYEKCFTFYNLLRQTVRPDTLVVASQIENRFYKPNNRFGWPPGRAFDLKRRRFNEFLKNKPFQDSLLKVEGPDLLDKKENYRRDGVHLNGLGLNRFFGAIEDKLNEVSRVKLQHKSQV